MNADSPRGAPSPGGRRRALAVIASSLASSLAAVAAGVLAAGCGEKEPPRCDDPKGLTAVDVENRTKLAYADRSPDPERACDRCVQWVPGPASHLCGGCRLFGGPVSPAGTCKVFAKRG